MLGRFTNAARASSTFLGRPVTRSLQRPCLAPIVTQPILRHRRLASSTGTTASISPESGEVHITSPTGVGASRKLPRQFTFQNLWLRDNCQCSQCINQDTRQRNFDTFQLSKESHPVSITDTTSHLLVEWSDSHKSEHPWPWLEAWLVNGQRESFGQDHATLPWGGKIANNPPDVSYQAVMDQSNEKGIADLTRKIWQHGFCFVSNTPPTPEDTERLLQKIGPIRTTHYGGFYDFIPDLALADTAYTNLALPAHTDTTYFTEPAGLQAFHLLSHQAPPNAEKSNEQPSETEQVLGGKSLLVDGFNAVGILRKEDPWAYEVLKFTPIPWHASGNKGIAITPDTPYPVIESRKGVLTRVRWNNDDRGVVDPIYAHDWYEAAAKWNEILRREESEFWFQLEPGRVVIFDNWRVLHGRSAFEGIRRICGGYIPRDDFMSRYRTTNFPNDHVIGRNMNMRPRRSTADRNKAGELRKEALGRKVDEKGNGSHFAESQALDPSSKLT